MLEIGDSLGKDLGWGLDRQVPPATGLNLVLADQSSTGLVNTSFFDWRATLAADLAQYHPQLVLVCLGGNDEQGMMVNGSAQQFPSAPWQAAYLARVRQLVAEATGSGAYLLWVGMPIMGIPGYSAGMQILNGIYQQAVASDPNAVFVPLWQLFSGPGGSFAAGAQVNGKAASLRQADDIHYSVTGEDVAATYVAQQLAARFHIQLAPADPQVITGW